MDMSRAWLEQKAIVIIGGTTGIGWTAAESFIDHGASVVVVGRDDESAAQASSELKKKGLAFAGDAAAPDTAVHAIHTCFNTFGSFDGLYHVAGGSGRKFGDGRFTK